MSKKSTFSERLKEIVMEKNIRQADLCAKTQIGKSAMSQYLSGSFEPKQKNLFRLSEALGVSEAWLMGYDVPKGPKRSLQDQIEPPDDDSFFYYTAADDSMVNGHIPLHAKVLVERDAIPEDQQIVVCIVDSEMKLRRYVQSGSHILLIAENSHYQPDLFTEDHVLSGQVQILGVARRVILDL